MLIAADYPLLEVIWTMLVFFGLVIWIRLLFTVFGEEEFDALKGKALA